MNASPAPTSRPVSTSMNAATAAPRAGRRSRRRPRSPGWRRRTPTSSAPTTASVIADRRGSPAPARGPGRIASASSAMPEDPDRDPEPDPPLDREQGVDAPSSARPSPTRRARSPAASSTSDGLIVCSAARIVVDACCASMSTRRPARGLEDLLVRPAAKSRIASSTGGVRDRGRAARRSRAAGRRRRSSRCGRAAASPGRRCSRGPPGVCEAFATTSANPSSSSTRVSSHQPKAESVIRKQPASAIKRTPHRPNVRPRRAAPVSIAGESGTPNRARKVAPDPGSRFPAPERRRRATFSTCEHRLDGLRSRCWSCSR